MSHIKNIIDSTGLSLREIATRSDLRPSTVCDAYNGKHTPQRRTIAAIARACGADVRETVQAVLAEQEGGAE